VIITAQLACVGAIFYGASLATTWQQLLLLAVGFGIVGNSVYSIIHEAEHRILHPNPKLNDVLGAGMALLFPAAFHLIRQGHIGHHLRNRSDDEAFDFYFYGEQPILKWLQLYGILTGLYWATVVLSNFIVLICPFVLKRRYFEFDRPSSALMDSFNPNYWPIIKIEALMAIVLHVLISRF
jgi:fatty acid desaturase